jgi:hypothetical protein
MDNSAAGIARRNLEGPFGLENGADPLGLLIPRQGRLHLGAAGRALARYGFKPPAEGASVLPWKAAILPEVQDHGLDRPFSSSSPVAFPETVSLKVRRMTPETGDVIPAYPMCMGGA